MTILIGTSGWQYDDWKDAFYPPGMPTSGWLDHYAARFATVEINNSFYQLPERDTFAAWAGAVPDDFVFAPKVSRYLSHMKKLKDPDEPARRFCEHASGLGDKLGPLLLQLPPNFKAAPDRLEAALGAFPSDVRLAVEFRDDSWYRDEVRAVLEHAGAALCWADRDSRLVTPTWATADWGYIRFHAGAASPAPCYGRTALATRAELLAERWGAGATVFAFFNNDTRCCAVRDARRFALACDRVGLEPTRVPTAGEVRLAG